MTISYRFSESEPATFVVFKIITKARKPGWYWQALDPSGLPGPDPHGPFDSRAAAVTDARDTYGDG